MTGYFEELYNTGLSGCGIKAVEVNLKMFMQPSIQERIKEASGNIIREIEAEIDKFILDPKAYKKFDSVKFFRSNPNYPSTCKAYPSYYEGILGEYLMLQNCK